jgi:hypothetical protein
MGEPLSKLTVVPVDHDIVEFWPAGTLARGAFVCSACGHVVYVNHVLPRCKGCGERLWERRQT